MNFGIPFAFELKHSLRQCKLAQFVTFLICTGETRGFYISAMIRYILTVLSWFPSLTPSYICHWDYSLTQSFRSHCGPGVDSASNRDEYQEYFLGVNAAGAEGWQSYHLHVSTVLKSGSLKLLEPSGSAQACNGIALPLSLPPSYFGSVLNYARFPST